MKAGQSTESRNALIAEHLCCVRGDKMLFSDLEFSLQAGQAGLVTGPNGIGKSSLLRLIAGLLEPFAGGFASPATLALCDDKLALDENQPLQSALEFWARMDGKTADEIRTAMVSAGLDHLAEVPICYFSTGQRQRARLARTYLTGAKLWLLDEPANGLDTGSVNQLGMVMQSHLDSGGIILATSHIPLPIDFNLSLALDSPA